MKTYFFDLINKVKRVSISLDAKAILCNKTWRVFNDNGDKELYIFMEDGTLITSTNGNVDMGKWIYIPVNQSLVITGNNQNYLVHPLLFKNILALVKDGTDNCAFLIDDTEKELQTISTLESVQSYLETIIHSTNNQLNYDSLIDENQYVFGENGVLNGDWLWLDVKQIRRSGNKGFGGHYTFNSLEVSKMAAMSDYMSPFQFLFENSRLTHINCIVPEKWKIKAKIDYKSPSFFSGKIKYSYSVFYEECNSDKKWVDSEKDSLIKKYGNEFNQILNDHKEVFINLLDFDPTIERYWEWK